MKIYDFLNKSCCFQYLSEEYLIAATLNGEILLIELETLTVTIIFSDPMKEF